MRTVSKKPLLWLPVLLLTAGLALTGCDSDSVAPQDELPPLTANGAAQQAGVMAAGLAQASPQIVDFSGTPVKNVYSYDFAGQDAIEGMVYLDFRMGSETGDPATSSAGTWARLYTASGSPVDFMIEIIAGSPGHIYLAFDIRANVNQATHSAVILENSTCTYAAGDYSGTCSFSDIHLQMGASSPTSGTMTIVAGSHTSVVTFDGDHTATVVVDEAASWSIDLDTGQVTAIAES